MFTLICCAGVTRNVTRINREHSNDQKDTIIVQNLQNTINYDTNVYKVSVKRDRGYEHYTELAIANQKKWPQQSEQKANIQGGPKK